MSDYGLHPDCSDSPSYEKAPLETIRLRFYFAQILDGEAIVTTEYLLPSGFTNEGAQEDGTERAVLVSGGHCGSYRVRCTVTTDGNRTLELVRRVRVRHR